MLGSAIPQVKGGPLGDIKQLGVLATPLYAVVRPSQRVFEIMGNILIKLYILLISNLVTWACLQGTRLVNGLPLVGVLLLLGFFVVFLFPRLHRNGNITRLPSKRLAQAPAIEELVLIGT